MKLDKETVKQVQRIAGMAQLTSGTITSPVAYFDLVLPAGYAAFRLQLSGVLFSTTEGLAYAMSQDGGITFINNKINFDSYVVRWITPSPQTAGTFDVWFPDTFCDISGNHDSTASVGILVESLIDPGSASLWPSISSHCAYWDADAPNNSAMLLDTFCVVNSQATITPSLGRINVLRIVPYGNGDVNPPTSGDTITAGSYILWGIL